MSAQQSTAQSRLQIYTAPPVAVADATSRRSQSVTFTVDAAATDWTATGLSVRAGDTLTFAATGSIALAGHTLTADGMTRGWKDMLRHFPVDSADAGALVGRIGSSDAVVPFAIGTAATIVASQAGPLFLRVNASAELPAAGSLHVTVRVGAGAAPAGAHAADAVTAPAFLGLQPAMIDALPRRVTDANGAPGDAINFALIGTGEQVAAAFARAGWVAVDSNTQAALLHGLLSTLQHKPYLEMPMSTLYLFGRPQDLSYARASAISVAADRNHLRCWQTTDTVNGLPLWVGAATHDVGFERDQRNGELTHKIAPEIDLEREYLRDSFLSTGAAVAAAYITPDHPLHTANTATGGSFTTDGRVLLLQLR